VILKHALDISGAPVPYPPGSSHLVTGLDPNVRAPVVDINVGSLAKLAKTAGYSGIALRYMVCISKAGEIIAIQNRNARQAEVPEIIAALKSARVASPGRRGDKAVPTAIPVTIPTR